MGADVELSKTIINTNSRTDSANPAHVHETSSFSQQLRLTGKRLALARLAWVGVVGFIMIVFIASIVPHFRELSTVQDSQTRSYYMLTPAEGVVLESWGITPIAYAIWLDAFALTMLAGYLILGFLLFWRRSDNPLAMFLALAIISIGVTYNTSVSSLASLYPEWQFAAGMISLIGVTTAVICLFILPDGWFFPTWTKYLTVFFVVYMVGIFLYASVTGANGTDKVLNQIRTLGNVPIFLCGLLAQYHRYRTNSDARARQQIRWVVIGLFVAIIGFTAYVLPPFLFPALERGSGRLLLNLIGAPLFVVLPSFMVPVTVGLAIVRHRLLGVEVFISSALVIAAMTGILGLLYVIGVVIFQQAFHLVTGGEQSPLAITISTLIIAALFTPIRQRLQTLIMNQFVVRRSVDKRTTFITDMPAVALGSGRLTGQVFGNYQIERLIGQGGMAEVYRAQHTTLKREAAIKALSPNLALDQDFRRRFEREAQTIATLAHPNIVQVFDYGESDGNFYMAMAYIPGENLAVYLSRAVKIPLSTAIIPLRDVAAALDFAHERDVIHRDVKPSNVMLAPIPNGSAQFPYRAILADFGLARVVTGSGANTQTGVLGTLSYIAPEQIMNSRDVTAVVDVYALGVIAYQMLTGHVPFEGENIGEILMAHLQRNATDPREFAPDLAPGAATAILRALHKHPDDRYQTAGEFVAALAIYA